VESAEIAADQVQRGCLKQSARRELISTRKPARKNPTRWTRSIRFWYQPEEVWINKPPEEPEAI
jgi:hypothetical protein